MDEPNVVKKRDRSPEYPATSLRAAVDYVRRLYDQDRQNWTSAEVAVKHLGYSSLNGTSRTTLSSLRKFGLIEYRGGDLRVSDSAMKILLPHSDSERAQALEECLRAPKIYVWMSEQYPGWDLPSDETIHSRLVRDLDFNPSSTRGFLTDLRDTLEYVRAAGGLSTIQPEAPEAQVSPKPSGAQVGVSDHGPGHRLSSPGQAWFVWLPDVMSPAEAALMKRWVQKVLIPNLDFITGADNEMGGGE